jgi:pimeloyl-ACP methyl ester carboxylesterase
MHQTKPDKINIFGYSMGGYVALYLAAHHPEAVDRIITLGTKYQWSPEIAAKETAMLNPVAIETKVPKFAAQLSQRHSPADWKIVLEKTASMLLEMGSRPPLQIADFSQIKNEVLLLLGDKDKMVTLQETAEVFRQLPNAQLGVLPNTSHPVEAADKEHLAFVIRKFLQ